MRLLTRFLQHLHQVPVKTDYQRITNLFSYAALNIGNPFLRKILLRLMAPGSVGGGIDNHLFISHPFYLRYYSSKSLKA